MTLAQRPDRDHHLLGDHRRARSVVAAARHAVADPRQLRGGGSDEGLRPGRRRGGDRRRRRPAARRLHHHLPVVAPRVPARGRDHRDRALRHRTRPRRAVHRPAGDRPGRRRALRGRHGRHRAQHPGLAGGRRIGRRVDGGRRVRARVVRVLAGAPQARGQADADRSGPVQVEGLPARDLGADAAADRARRHDDRAARSTCRWCSSTTRWRRACRSPRSR